MWLLYHTNIKKGIHHWCDQFQGYEGRDAKVL
jgi:hypothetical protein